MLHAWRVHGMVPHGCALSLVRVRQSGWPGPLLCALCLSLRSAPLACALPPTHSLTHSHRCPTQSPLQTLARHTRLAHPSTSRVACPPHSPHWPTPCPPAPWPTRIPRRCRTQPTQPSATQSHTMRCHRRRTCIPPAAVTRMCQAKPMTTRRAARRPPISRPAAARAQPAPRLARRSRESRRLRRDCRPLRSRSSSISTTTRVRHRRRHRRKARWA